MRDALVAWNWSARRGVVLGRQRSGEHLAVHAEGDVAARDVLQLRGDGVVEQEADAQRAKNLRLRQPDGNRHRHELEHAVRLWQQAEAFTPCQCTADRRLTGRDERRSAGCANHRQHLAVLVRHEQEVRLELVLIAVGDVLHGRRIVRVHCRLHLRRVRNEACHLGEGLGPRGPQLIDERRGREELSLQRTFGLFADPNIDEIHSGANRQHGQQRARQKDAAAKRREDRHRSGKSNSVTPPSATVTGLGSEAVPSFHATTPYVPGGTLSIR